MEQVPALDALAELKVAADAGDRIAQERLVEVLGEIAERRIRGRYGSSMEPADIDDVAQEVRYRLCRSIGACRADSGPPIIAWTWAVARNCIHDHYRKKPDEPVLSGSLPDPRSEAHETSEDLLSPLMRIVAEEAATLESDEQRLLYLRLVEGATWPEVGSVLGITRHAAKRRWQRLRARFRTRVIDAVGDLPESERRAVLMELEERDPGGLERGSSSD